MFDVDDLMANTLGGLIGYILMIPLGLLLPSRHRIDAASYRRGRKVSLFRWLIAIGIDMALYAWMAVYAGSAWPLAHMRFLAYMTAIAVVVSSLMSWIFAGRTLGLAIMSLKVVSKDQRRAPLYKLFLRYSIQYLFILGYPLICQIFYYRINSHQTQFLLIAIGIYGFIWLVDLLVFLEKDRIWLVCFQNAFNFNGSSRIELKKDLWIMTYEIRFKSLQAAIFLIGG